MPVKTGLTVLQHLTNVAAHMGLNCFERVPYLDQLAKLFIYSKKHFMNQSSNNQNLIENIQDKFNN